MAPSPEAATQCARFERRISGSYQQGLAGLEMLEVSCFLLINLPLLAIVSQCGPLLKFLVAYFFRFFIDLGQGRGCSEKGARRSSVMLMLTSKASSKGRQWMSLGRTDPYFKQLEA